MRSSAAGPVISYIPAPILKTELSWHGSAVEGEGEGAAGVEGEGEDEGDFGFEFAAIVTFIVTQLTNKNMNNTNNTCIK